MAAVVEQQAVRDDERLIIESFVSSKPVPSNTRLTFEQATKLAGGRLFELIQGRMVFKMPDKQHAYAQGWLGGELYIYFKTNSIGVVLPEFMIRLWPENPYEGRMPDLSVILNENLEEERYGSRAPDLAIEILSRDDDRNALIEKAKLYLENGSRIVWIVDPFQKGVMVITPDDRRWVTETLTCPELLPGFSVNVQDIWAWPAAPSNVVE
jgi:Uma2 family endonuclease